MTIVPIDPRMQKPVRLCRNQKKYIERARADNSPFLYNLEKIHYETQIAYRTIVERLHSEV